MHDKVAKWRKGLHGTGNSEVGLKEHPFQLNTWTFFIPPSSEAEMKLLHHVHYKGRKKSYGLPNTTLVWYMVHGVMEFAVKAAHLE